MNYKCVRIDKAAEPIAWSHIEAMTLSEVVGGQRPRLLTVVRACWSTANLHIRFECEDDHLVATMKQRGDPLFQEDVVEVFIDELGGGKVYREFVVSPRNVVYEALIHNDLRGDIMLDTTIRTEGLATKVEAMEAGSWSCELSIPLTSFQSNPDIGTEWGWNLYRIDEDKQGERHYWAWSPTGAINYHIPQRFGKLVFSDNKPWKKKG